MTSKEYNEKFSELGSTARDEEISVLIQIYRGGKKYLTYDEPDREFQDLVSYELLYEHKHYDNKPDGTPQYWLGTTYGLTAVGKQFIQEYISKNNL